MLVSIVIRTLNEARYLRQLLEGVRAQETGPFQVETVVIDSGSTDGTVAIAREFGCVLTTIRREDFSFGRSLNQGCEAASGEILVFVSGHCVPRDNHWLRELCLPIQEGRADYTYGRQIGGAESQFSECRIFDKYFPGKSAVPQQGFFCNNANSALSRNAWEIFRFDEELTGLEDMDLAKRLSESGGRIGYIAEACVYHLHHEKWSQVQRRFEREALALQKIMPQIHVSALDAVRYIFSSIIHDTRLARRERLTWQLLPSIVRYRFAQYVGSYKGNHEHRKLSKAQKEIYFFPSNRNHDSKPQEAPDSRPAANEGEQRARAR